MSDAASGFVVVGAAKPTEPPKTASTNTDVVEPSPPAKGGGPWPLAGDGALRALKTVGVRAVHLLAASLVLHLAFGRRGPPKKAEARSEAKDATDRMKAVATSSAKTATATKGVSGDVLPTVSFGAIRDKAAALVEVVAASAQLHGARARERALAERMMDPQLRAEEDRAHKALRLAEEAPLPGEGELLPALRDAARKATQRRASAEQKNVNWWSAEELAQAEQRVDELAVRKQFWQHRLAAPLPGRTA